VHENPLKTKSKIGLFKIGSKDFARQFWIANFEGHFRVIMKVVTKNHTKNIRNFKIMGLSLSMRLREFRRLPPKQVDHK
jgi:hypothetical protein